MDANFSWLLVFQKFLMNSWWVTFFSPDSPGARGPGGWFLDFLGQNNGFLQEYLQFSQHILVGGLEHEWIIFPNSWDDDPI